MLELGAFLLEDMQFLEPRLLHFMASENQLFGQLIALGSPTENGAMHLTFNSFWIDALVHDCKQI
jgi:hypothetical protein